MRFLAWIMILLVALGALTLVYSLWAAELRVSDAQVLAIPATQMLDSFEALREYAEKEAVQGIQYADFSHATDPNAYVFYRYEVSVRNLGLLPAEWVELNVPQQEGMLVQETNLRPPTLPRFGSSPIYALVLAQNGSAPAANVTLTYFVFGRPYSLSIPVVTATSPQ